MPRKTMKMTEIRALANRYLAGSDPELTEFRRGIASMYEHLAMAANDYHGYNDLVQLWAGEPGRSAYIEDKAHRRSYHGPVDGPDAAYAQDAIDRYRESGDDPEIARREILVAEAKTVPYVIDRELAGYGTGPAWLVLLRDQHFVISVGRYGDSGPETQAFRSDRDGKITNWDDVAGGFSRTHAETLADLAARPVDEYGRVLSPKDVLDEREAAAEQCESCGCAAEPVPHPVH